MLDLLNCLKLSYGVKMLRQVSQVKLIYLLAHFKTTQVGQSALQLNRIKQQGNREITRKARNKKKRNVSKLSQI